MIFNAKALCDSLPWEGVGRGLVNNTWRTNPSLPIHSSIAPLPREGIKRKYPLIAVI